MNWRFLSLVDLCNKTLMDNIKEGGGFVVPSDWRYGTVAVDPPRVEWRNAQEAKLSYGEMTASVFMPEGGRDAKPVAELVSTEFKSGSRLTDPEALDPKPSSEPASQSVGGGSGGGGSGGGGAPPVPVPTPTPGQVNSNATVSNGGAWTGTPVWAPL